MGLNPKHNFNVGDRITVFDPFTAVAPYIWATEFHVTLVEDDYFTVMTTGANVRYERIPRTYKHMRLEKAADPTTTENK